MLPVGHIGGPPQAGWRYLGHSCTEVLWKLVATIIDGHLQTSITFHPTLHSRPCRGTGTAIIEAKLFQHLAWLQQPKSL